ncbi:MAG: hypothetical protein HYW16_01575 [Candidatus Rokubacteria bacterium]|nr:hypothetical protein [Candidatus Rokubacteria bacterium]MBI2543910.1 hypothetical protein [Candidatus Rokubacteria bacterium]
MTMAREGTPAAAIVDRIQRAIPDPESRKPLLGHLGDSRNAFEAEGKDDVAEILEQLIRTLEKADSR